MKLCVPLLCAIMLFGCKKEGTYSSNTTSIDSAAAIVDTTTLIESEPDLDAVQDEDVWMELFPILNFSDSTENSSALLTLLQDSFPNYEFTTFYPLNNTTYLVPVQGGSRVSGLYSVDLPLQKMEMVVGGDVSFEVIAGDSSGVACIVVKSNAMYRGRMSNWWTAIVPQGDKPLKLFSLTSFVEDGESGGMPSKERAAEIGLDTAVIMESFDMGYSGENNHLFIRFDCSFMDAQTGRNWAEQQQFELHNGTMELFQSYHDGSPVRRKILKAQSKQD